MSSSQLSYRVKLALFVLCAIAILFLVDTAYQGLNTLSRLNVVEAERDQWQRPSEVIQALDLKPGNVVCRSGMRFGIFHAQTFGASGPKRTAFWQRTSAGCRWCSCGSGRSKDANTTSALCLANPTIHTCRGKA